MKNKFLVNRMESIILVDANNSNDYASVNTQKDFCWWCNTPIRK